MGYDGGMKRLFDSLPWSVLLLLAVILGLAPFRPELHLLEKLRLLAQGRLTAPIDIFDLCLHGAPLLLLLGKLLTLKGSAAKGPP